MKFIVCRIEVKADDDYLAQIAKNRIYNESVMVVEVPDEFLADTKAVTTPEIMKFVISDLSQRTGWDIISCRVVQVKQ